MVDRIHDHLSFVPVNGSELVVLMVFLLLVLDIYYFAASIFLSNFPSFPQSESWIIDTSSSMYF